MEDKTRNINLVVVRDECILNTELTSTYKVHNSNKLIQLIGYIFFYLSVFLPQVQGVYSNDRRHWYRKNEKDHEKRIFYFYSRSSLLPLIRLSPLWILKYLEYFDSRSVEKQNRPPEIPSAGRTAPSTWRTSSNYPLILFISDRGYIIR